MLAQIKEFSVNLTVITILILPTIDKPAYLEIPDDNATNSQRLQSLKSTMIL
jgi:hypothetical protein